MAPVAVQQTVADRDFRQAQGQISQTSAQQIITGFDQVPPLNPDEKRWFGIGQGNLRVTPLQVADTMAAIARGGLYKKPRLFIEQIEDTNDKSVSLGISPQTLATVREGMYAVVNEPGGTAYNQFLYTGFKEQGIEVFGKTGSTEGTVVAWFAGFAQDNTDRSIALAVIVEGGEHGSSDAAPLARSIIQFCIEEGYIGQRQ